VKSFHREGARAEAGYLDQAAAHGTCVETGKVTKQPKPFGHTFPKKKHQKIQNSKVSNFALVREKHQVFKKDLVNRSKNFAVVRGSGEASLTSIMAFKFVGDLDETKEI
jgi:hypothetical protein